MRAEFLRLRKGAPGERLARNAGRETEIVLDAGARPCLAAERACIDDEHGESLGAGINRGCQARRSRAGDGDVIDRVVGADIQHADATRELGFARIAQHRAIGTDRERQLLRLRRITRDERLRIAVAGRVEDDMRNAVAAEKAAQPRDVGRGGGADQHRPASS